MRISAWQIVLLVILVILLFGAKRLPELAKSVGQSLKIFKSEVKDLRDDDAPAGPSTPASGYPAGRPADRPLEHPSEQPTTHPVAPVDRTEDTTPRSPQV